MDRELIGLLIALIAVTGGLALPFFVLYHQNKERRALIEKGMDPNLVFPWRRSANSKSTTSPPAGSLVWGVLLASVGGGILLGFLGSFYFAGTNVPVITNGTAVLCGGLGLILHHKYEKKERTKAD